MLQDLPVMLPTFSVKLNPAKSALLQVKMQEFYTFP